MTTHAAHGHGKSHPHGAAHPHEKPYYPHWPLASLLFAVVFLLGLFSVHESSTWINIRTGQWILFNHALPLADPFSYTMAGRPWTTASWLSDILFYLLHRGFGPQALIALKSLAAALAFSLLLPINPASPLTAATVLGLGALASWTGFAEKPAIFDLLMLALLVRVLRPRKPFRWSLVAKVALIEVLWANLHGVRAVIGVWMALLKTFKALLRSTSTRERLRPAAILAAALLGLACNPHGLGLVGLTFNGAGGIGFSWSEFPAWFNLYALFAAAGLVACVICLQQEFFLSITAATLLVFSMLVPSVRPLYILAVCPVLTLAAGHFLAPKRLNAARFARWGAVMALLFWLHWTLVYLPLGRWRGYGVDALDGALHFIKDNGVRGRLFNEAQGGASIIGGANVPVFVDERVALYDPAFMKDAARWPENLHTLTEVYRFDFALVLNRRARYPARVLDGDPAWRLAYADDAALVYLRRLGMDAPLLQNAPARLIAPNRLWPDSLDDLLRQPKLQPKVLSELDGWILEAPEASQPLIWKAYALDRFKLSEKADRLMAQAQARPEFSADPELMAAAGFFYAKRGDADRAEKLLLSAAELSGRRADGALESQILGKLALLCRERGQTERADAYEKRSAQLAAANLTEE